MKSQRLVGIDKPVSELVLGSGWFSLEDKYQYFDLLDEFVAYSGTTIDTGRCYGESENVIGLWMESRGNRDQMLIITKGGLSKTNPNSLDEEIEKVIENDITISLEYLKTDFIDLYFLHRDNSSIPVGRIVECLNTELNRGRIHAWGGSNWEPYRINEANEYADQHGLTGFVAVSNNLSLVVPTGPYYEGLIWTDEAARYWHAETGIPLLAWSSQARGFFTGRFRPDIRDHPNMVRVYYTDENFERLHRAEQLGKQKGNYSAVQVGLAWVLHQPFTVVPIVGPRTKEEVVSCVNALQIELTEAEIKWLNLQSSDLGHIL